MSEETWHAARLIPTSGINGATEQERRATSALLAVMSVVPDFSKSLLSSLGAPAAAPSTFIEVPFDLEGARVYPDGLIRVKRGARQWTALVEVKTGKNALDAKQLENYLDIARSENFDTLITISNEIPPTPGQHPTSVDRRKLRRVAMVHWSWSYILATAIVQKEHRGVSDPEQAWILGELIRYLEHERSGALELEDMGVNWVPVREAVGAGTLRPGDPAAAEVVSRFDALLRYASLRLGQRLGTDVVQSLSRKELADPKLRQGELLKTLATTGVLEGAIRIPGAVSTIVVTADLRATQVTCHIDVPAPQSGRATTRVNWLVRQMKGAPDHVRIEAFAARTRGRGTAELLGAVRTDPKILIDDPQRELRSFRIAQSAAMGSKRGRGRGSFIDSVLDTLDAFYGDVVQNIKPWSPAPPKLRAPVTPDPESDGLSSTDLSSQDEDVAHRRG